MRLCLNMIVKNEMANLDRCLRSLADHIDSWVICDTGSEDGTPDFIRRFFAERSIPGELHVFPFETFEQARNAALVRARAAAAPSDYLLLADADMEFVVEDPAVWRGLTAPAAMLRQSNGVTYWNIRLLRRDAQARYRGVTHEYLDVAGGEIPRLAGARFIDHASGANRPGKFRRDADLLQRALASETDPGLLARYTFYLANTLRDDGRPQAALDAYLRRAELGHWPQEVFVSLLNAGRLKERLNQAAEDVIATYLAAIAACPGRAEAHHGAARYCRNHGLHARGFALAGEALTCPAPDDALFREDWIYRYGLLDEYAINAYWAGAHRECLDACRTLLAGDALPEGERARVAANARFASDRLAEAPARPAERPWSMSATLGRRAAAEAGWAPGRPLAGTELMVEALHARLGPVLDAVQLGVNGYDPTRRDGRPLVVWFHHDIDQAAVQWCRDPALTEPIARFVFISYWQRERFVAAFGLPAERCVVIKYALEPAAEPRRWEAAPVLRCAYTSTPFRGLDILLDAWERVPAGRAELHVWSSMRLYAGDDAPYRHLLARARATPGVVYHGLAPNAALREALRGMHFLTYPNTFAETACLSVMEAMSAGCRVIVPSHGVLPETTGGYARVYPWSPDKARHAALFADVLAQEFADPWEGRPGEALDQQAYCATIFGWERRLGEWRRLIAELEAGPPALTIPAAIEDTPMTRALLRLRNGGFDPAGIVDVGAFDGLFARAARQMFPAARLLMIDALAEKDPVLAETARALGNAEHVIALLGESEEEATPFFVVDTAQRPDLVKTGSSVFRENAPFPMVERSIPRRRLDGIVGARGMPVPFVKVDVQGAELSVLRGLGDRLAEVEVVLIEMSLVAYNAGAPLFAEVVAQLDAWGFVLLDLVEEHRYRDGRLLQLDGVFVRTGSPLRPHPPFWN